MIIRKLESTLFSVQNSLFVEFVANSGGAISVNHSEVHIESIASGFYSCEATGSDYYNREKISGGAIAFFGISSYLEKNCFERCQGPHISSSVYVRSTQGSNVHLMNTYSRNFDGDGVLTSDGENDITLKDNNFSYSSSPGNTALSAGAPAEDSILRNSFVDLNCTTRYYYVWTYWVTKFTECNFVNMNSSVKSMFRIYNGAGIIRCILKAVPPVLAESGFSFSALNSLSDEPKYAGTSLITEIDVSSELITYSVGGNIQCKMNNRSCGPSSINFFALIFFIINLI